MAEIIDGKAIARQLDEKTKAEVDALIAALTKAHDLFA